MSRLGESRENEIDASEVVWGRGEVGVRHAKKAGKNKTLIDPSLAVFRCATFHYSHIFATTERKRRT